MRLRMALLAACFVVVALYSHQTGSGLGPASPAQRPAMTLANISGATPLYFIANEGQMSAEALYYARTPGYTLWLTEEGLVFDRVEKAAKGEAARSFSKMMFLGANKDIEIAAADPADYRVSYFMGRDEADWKTGISTSKAVLYKNVYDGIDLKVYGTERQVEYDWIVAPGADPGRIKFAYSGPEQAKLNADGDLVVETSAGQILQRKPVSHQTIDGRNVAIESAFRTLPDGSFGFSLGAYDPRRALTIDPLVHAYSTYLGGHNYDSYPHLVVDWAGAMYIRGYTLSGDFPPEMGGQPRTDDFVTKLSPDGAALIYTAFFPTGSVHFPGNRGLDVDAKGFVYLCGTTSSNKFPLKNPFQAKFEGDYDGYVLKLSRDGRSLVYSSYIGGDDLETCATIVADATGAAYVGGFTFSKNFPLKRPFRNKLAGRDDGFVAKVSPQGSSLVYSTYIGGSDYDGVRAIALDAKGSAVLAGLTNSTNFPVKAAFQRNLGGESDAFVAKLTPAGNALVYSSYFGGTADEELEGLALDGTGAVYIAGTTNGKIPVRNAYQSVNKGLGDGFFAKIAPNGRAVVYASYLGGRSVEALHGIAVAEDGAVYLTGGTESANFPVKSPFQPSRLGSRDAFLTIVHPSGMKLLASTYLGGIYRESGWGVALGGDGAIYLSGITNSPDLPMPRSGAYQGALAGDIDTFIFKFTTGDAGLRR